MRTPHPNRVLLYAFAMYALLTSLLPPDVGAAQAQQNCRKLNAFEVCGRFLEEWSKQGSEQASLYVNGLPITTRRAEISMEDGKLYDTQWFERARYELHPENKAPYDVLLGRLGYSTAEGRGKIDPVTGRAANPTDQPFVGIDKPADAEGKSKAWFQETKHTISGKILEYWNKYGGLPQFGYPLSEPFQEISQADGKSYTVQYFERNRMELHPEKPAPYDVELGLLGVEQYRLQAVAADQLPVVPTKDVISRKDSIVVGMNYEPRNLTFADNSPTGRPANRRVLSLIEDQLVARDDNENIFPLNAWYVPTLENGGAYFVGVGDDRHLRVKYRIRQGIKWSDGKELTSNDAMFAYRLLMHPDAPVPDRSEYLRLQRVDNPGKYTIIYSYKSAREAADFYGQVPNKEAYGFLKVFVDQKKPVISRAYSEIGVIYPEHVLGKIPPAKIVESEIASAPIGTGPWKIKSWNKGQEIVLVPNEQYSLTAKPAIKTIRIKFLPYLMEGQVKTGEIDLVTSDMFNTGPADKAGFEGAGYKIASKPASTWEHLDYYFGYGPFKEQPVREAIFIGINRQRIVDAVYGGAGAVFNGVVPPGVYYSIENPNFARNYPGIAAKYKPPDRDYNPARANQLLDQAGWFRGPDGIRTKGGVKLSFEYGTTTQYVRQQIQALVSTDLKAIGVDAVTKNYPAGIFFDNSPQSPRANGTIKLAQFSHVTTRDNDFSTWICPVDPYDSSHRWMFVWACLHSPDLERANATFNSEIDPAAQVSAAAEAQVMLMGEIVTIPLVQRANIEIVRNTLANYKPTNSLVSSFWNMRQWYFR